jgi:hypothetical protein
MVVMEANCGVLCHLVLLSNCVPVCVSGSARRPNQHRER